MHSKSSHIVNTEYRSIRSLHKPQHNGRFIKNVYSRTYCRNETAVGTRDLFSSFTFLSCATEPAHTIYKCIKDKDIHAQAPDLRAKTISNCNHHMPKGQRGGSKDGYINSRRKI